MNKQEAIKEMGKIDGLTIKDKSVGFYIKMIPEVEILKIIKQIDEPEKHVVPQYVAEYIEYCKHEKFYALHGAYANMDDRLKCWRFKGNNSELFAKAWLFSYEVEKEKRYTAKLKLTDEYLVYYASIKDLHHAKTTDNAAKRQKVFHFTEDDLVKYHIWGNDNYEVKEVEE